LTTEGHPERKYVKGSEIVSCGMVHSDYCRVPISASN
jgi:hypothetical protein